MNERSSGVASQVEIIRDGQNVHFVVSCPSDYDAMLLYDRLGEEMKQGFVRLDIHSKAKETSKWRR
jgi:hypothetical protein